MPNHNDEITPFDVAVQFTERALLDQLDRAQRVLVVTGILPPSLWLTIRADFDAYRQLVAERDRWRSGERD